VEKRTTRSWDVSIRNSIREINRTNRRHKSGGTYADNAELRDIITEAMPSAIDRASLEVKEGLYDSTDLIVLFDNNKVLEKAFDLINNS
jgi:hypothetical protein